MESVEDRVEDLIFYPKCNGPSLKGYKHGRESAAFF